jgi:hypothetical protein
MVLNLKHEWLENTRQNICTLGEDTSKETRVTVYG